MNRKSGIESEAGKEDWIKMRTQYMQTGSQKNNR